MRADVVTAASWRAHRLVAVTPASHVLEALRDTGWRTVADAPALVREGAPSIEVGVSDEAFGALASALGSRAIGLMRPLWRDRSITLRCEELAYLASGPLLGREALFADVTALTARGGAVEIRLETSDLD